MWFLISTIDAGLRFSLPKGRELIVGRKDCDILIQGDQSISRKHATICVEGDAKPGRVYLTDCKSKFGTSVNKRKLSANERVELHGNDIIKFGQGPIHNTSRFKLVFEPLVFCCSGMERAERVKVKELAKVLGARVLTSWTPECSHLVMNTINVTVKVVSALSSCRPIVTPAWLEEAARCQREAKVLPSCLLFQPEVVDSNMGSNSEEVSFHPDFKRASLFQGKTFYFLTEAQYSRLHACVESAGARSQLATSQNNTSLQSLVTDQSIVLAVDSDVMAQLKTEEQSRVEQVSDFLRSHDLRVIMDSEIGFALLHKSIENYCNPRSGTDSPPVSDHLPPPTLSQELPLSYHTSTTPLPFTQEPSQTNVTVYAPETELTQQSLAAKETKGDTTSQPDVTTKVEETILFKKKSPKPPAAGGTSAKRGGTLDALFDISGGIDEERFPPAEVKSKLEKKGPFTSTQKFEGDSHFQQRKPLALRGEHSLESIVEDSQPNSEVPNHTVLPGLKKPTDVSVIGGRNEGPAPSSSIVDTNHSLPETEPSILVPSSLPPRSQEKSLPDASLVASLFKGKRRKRGPGDSDSQESQRESKRQHLDERSGGHDRKEDEKEQQSQTAGAGLFSGLQSMRSKGRTKLQENRKIHSNESVDSDVIETETNRLFDSSKPRECSSANSTTEPKLVPLDPPATTSETVGKPSSMPPPKTPKTPKTPKRRPREDYSSTSPFLSTRKHRKTEASQAAKSPCDTSMMTNTSVAGSMTNTAAAFTDNPATLACTQHTQNTTGAGLITPFTCLTVPAGVVCSTGGKRTKASTTTTNNDIWDDENRDDLMLGRGEGENPLGSQEPPRKNYRPVYTEDGFIVARSKPKLLGLGIRRLGLLSSECSSGGDVCGEGEENSVPTAVVDISFVSLVAERGRREDDGVMREEEEEQTGIKNFKKFRKVKHTGGGIPRIIGLVQYVPPSNQELQDWNVDTRGVDECDTRTEESSQDLFRFTLPTKRRRT